MMVSQDLSEHCGSLGLSGNECAALRGQRKAAEAIVAYVNSTGGIAGRTVKPVIFENDPVAGGPYSAQAQRVCASFTEDNEVYIAVSNNRGGDDSLLACLARAETPLVEISGWPFDKRYYNDFAGYLYQPSLIRADEWVSEYITGLASMKFFDSGVIGLVRFDAGVYKRLSDGVLKPALAARGLELEEEVAVKTPSDPSQWGGLSAELNGAIVRFRASGVNRVLFLGPQELGFLFIQSAEAQKFRPRYGFASPANPGTLAGLVDANQLKGSMGVGWSPAGDVLPQDDDSPNRQPATDCDAVLREVGEPEHASSPWFYCDFLFWLDAVLTEMIDLGVSADRQGFAAGVEALGSSFASAATFSTRFGPGRHFGGSAIRYFKFDEACGCFKYSTPVRPLK